MPSTLDRPEGHVVRYEGRRGLVFRIKYRDATGRQVMETLGPAAAGWTERMARRELRNRLTDVQRDGYRKPERLTFEAFAERFKADYLPGRHLKPSTIVDYELTIRVHLVPFFGELELASIAPADVDAYIAAKTGKLSPKTISNHLGTLRVMFKVAKRWYPGTERNPVDDVDRPRQEQAEMQVLSEAEISRLLVAYGELEQSPPTETTARLWRQTRRLVVVALGTALRRGELLALRWRDVELLESRLHVRESIVRGKVQTPKSRASRRTLDLGRRTVAALQEQWQETAYRGDGELVFGHPELGTPLDPSKLSRLYMRPALAKAAISKPFRPWHDLRHTALTHEAAAGNPQVYVQLKAGHSQGSITERYIHAAQVLFPGAADRGEDRIFGPAVEDPVERS
jgi:integrase